MNQEIQHSGLLQLLSNSLILCHTAPYLPVADILNLAVTSRAFRYLIYDTPQVFRRIDLTPCKTAQFEIDAIDHGGETWRNVQVDENLTEDEFYSGPLRGIFSSLSRLNVLRDVQVLVLDGLSVTADLVHDILSDQTYSVRILSLRDCKHLNERKLRGALQYACRDSRPEGTPRLKGLYVFGKKDEPDSLLPAPSSATPSLNPSAACATVASAWNTRSQQALVASLPPVDVDLEPWYGRRGQQLCRPVNPDWAQTLVACDGSIAFDAVLCTGPRHLNSRAWGTVDGAALEAAGAPSVPPWAVAAYSLGGCTGCGSAPEGWTVWGHEDDEEDDERWQGTMGGRRRDSDGSSSNAGYGGLIGRFPLLRHAPLHSANVKVAMCPSDQPLNPNRRMSLGGASAATTEKARFIPRCAACLRDRYCTACHRWWCESCYTGPWAQHAHGVGASGTGAVNTGGDAGSGSSGPSSPDTTGNGEAKHKARVTKSCWECGTNCHDCIDTTQRMCRNCGGGYCIIHNEGSSHVHCDWCSKRGRRFRDLY